MFRSKPGLATEASRSTFGRNRSAARCGAAVDLFRFPSLN